MSSIRCPRCENCEFCRGTGEITDEVRQRETRKTAQMSRAQLNAVLFPDEIPTQPALPRNTTRSDVAKMAQKLHYRKQLAYRIAITVVLGVALGIAIILLIGK
jgi:hypothetical protein